MNIMVHLSLVDWSIILVYFVFIFLIGYAVKTRSRGQNDFFLAGRKNSAWIAGIAFISANLGALELLGMTGQSYQYGLLTAHYYLIGAIPAMIFLAVFMMPFYYSKKIVSVPSYLKFRFNGTTRTFNAAVFCILTILMSGINMYAMALVLNVFLGWSFASSMLVSSFAIAIYVGLGGLNAAIYSEIMQFFLIWFGLFLACILGVVHAGGWSHVIHQVPQNYMSLWRNMGSASHNPMMINWFGLAMGLGFVLSMGYWTTDFLVIQRAFSAKDLRSARLTPIIGSFFKMALPIIIVISAFCVISLQHMHVIPHMSSPDDALLYLLKAEYPHGLLGLGVTALLAGFMSGQAGNVSAFNTVFIYDLYKPYLVKHASDKHYLTMGRVMTLIGIILSVGSAYLAIHMGTIMNYMQALFAVVNAPLFAVILLGMFWKRINGPGGCAGLLVGTILSAIALVAQKGGYLPGGYIALTQHPGPVAINFWLALWSWFITSLITIAFSLMSAPQSPAELGGLVYKRGSDISRQEDLRQPYHRRVGFWACAALLVFLVINVYFW